MRLVLVSLVCVAGLAACNNPTDVAEEKMEQQAEATAVAAGSAPAALGLTELQLLDAELIEPANTEIGDVVKLERDTAGNVVRLLVEIEDSNPDRFVYVPVSELKPVVRGTDTDLQTTMTIDDLKAMPEVKIPPSNP